MPRGLRDDIQGWMLATGVWQRGASKNRGLVGQNIRVLKTPLECLMSPGPKGFLLGLTGLCPPSVG